MNIPKGLNRFLDKFLYFISGGFLILCLFYAADENLALMLVNILLSFSSWKLADYKPEGWE